MKVRDFHFDLPPELIAQEPLLERDASRMLVIDRAAGRWEDRHFRDLPQYLRPGDALIFNDTRVMPSRLYGHRAGGSGTVEVLFLRPVNADRREWQVLVRPGRRLHEGASLLERRESEDSSSRDRQTLRKEAKSRQD